MGWAGPTGCITAFSDKENNFKNADGIIDSIDNFIKINIVIVTQTFLTTFHHQKTYTILSLSLPYPMFLIGNVNEYGK
jgi:hypothetical protein